MKIERCHRSDLKKTEYQDADQLLKGNLPRLVDEELCFDFPDGIPAFEDYKRYALRTNEDIKPFLYLRSLDLEGLGFICIDPFLIKPDYSVKLSGKDTALLGLEDPSQAFVITFVTVAEEPENITTNLLAPIVLNVANCRGRQVILDSDLPVQFKIWQEIEKMEQQLKDDSNAGTDTEV